MAVYPGSRFTRHPVTNLRRRRLRLADVSGIPHPRRRLPVPVEAGLGDPQGSAGHGNSSRSTTSVSPEVGGRFRVAGGRDGVVGQPHEPYSRLHRQVMTGNLLLQLLIVSCKSGPGSSCQRQTRRSQMAQRTGFVCGSCPRVVKAWSDGNPGFFGEDPSSLAIS